MKKDPKHVDTHDDSLKRSEMVHSMEEVEELGKEMEQISQNEAYPIDNEEQDDESKKKPNT